MFYWYKVHLCWYFHLLAKVRTIAYDKNKGLVHHFFLPFGPLFWNSAFSVAKLWPEFPWAQPSKGWLPGYVACAIAQDPVLKSAPYLVYFSVEILSNLIFELACI